MCTHVGKALFNRTRQTGQEEEFMKSHFNKVYKLQDLKVQAEVIPAVYVVILR